MANRNALATIAYLIVGLLLLVVAVQVLGVGLNLIGRLLSALLSIALIASVVYLVYLFVRSALRRP